MESVLKIENVSKQYRLGLVGTGTLSHDLNRWWSRIRGKEDPYLKIGSTNDRNNIDSENIVDEFLDNAALEAGDYQSKLDEDPVQLMTIHSAKGLEFPIVFLTGLEEGIFPNENRKSGNDFLEEERRLCYVAITRAMKLLYITHANARYLHGSYNYLMPVSYTHLTLPTNREV